ncbi:FxSxx-COOH system tetratricopeptide repeat protein [Streptomyces sp. SP18CS02]|uniref:FxSxx-COOH system tetratricopeptide repeat protein n=1 Tax=Streptomyces sp. SP18CS02 TaxID=3002531 RepID=UPI002E7766E1|nr:FxSxx-COOH system tetratricopeptide repeat protein [Streptomyces sp. SP18CS02]MEE1757251.1 FxSxx-COOH system tetratricopeptide repeat protein [Streptomyces sp. SP18CS02]
MTEGSEHITVVFAAQSERWATWVEEELASAGFRTGLVRWDPLRRPPEGSALTELLAVPGRILLVLDDWYLRFDAGRYRAWADVLRTVLPGHEGRLAALSVTDRPLPEAVRDLDPVELRGVGAEEARRRLLALVGIDAPRVVSGVRLTRRRSFPDDPPPVWNVPRRNRRFTGRRGILEELRTSLTADRDGTAIVAVHGPGGVGKTQLAMEYAHRYAGEYDLVWWVRASTTSTARENFAALATELGLGGGAELRPLIDAVHRVLGTGDRRWLIVLDGAEDPERLADLLPEGPGHVLITSHRTAWSAHGADLLRAPRFHRDESVAYACRRATRLTEQEADQLADALEDLPLLVDQMAAWLDAHPMSPVSGYVEEIRHGSPSVFGVVPSGEDPRPFQAVWSMAVNTLHEDAPEAHELLKLLAFFSADIVPVRMLQAARSADLPPHLARMATEPSSWNTALRRLSESTAMWLEYETGPRADTLTVGTLRMHRLFHRFVRDSLPAADRATASLTACRVLVAADPREPTRPRHWARYAELIPHLVPSGALESDDDDVRRLVLNCVEYLRTRGEYHDGLALSRAALDHWSATSGRTDRRVLEAGLQHANMLRRLGRYADAETAGRAVLGDLESAGADGHGVETLRALNGLGGTLMALARYDEAGALYQRAAKDAVELLGEQVPLTLRLRTNLATATGLQGRYEESLAEHRHVFRERVGLLGERDSLTLLSAFHTSWTLRLLGRYADALAIQVRNVHLHRQTLDRSHSQTLLAEHNLALCMRREGDIDSAKAMMRSVHERLVRRRGSRHPETLLVATDYAMLLRGAGETEEARALAERTARLYAAVLGENHPYAIGARDNRALILRDLGRPRAALSLAEETMARMDAVLGPAHLWSVGCAMNTAGARAAAGDVAGAVALGRDALERARACAGDSHVLTVNVQAGLAQDLHAAGRRDEAGRLGRDALRRLAGVLGEDHPQVAHMRAGSRPYWDFEPQPY